MEKVSWNNPDKPPARGQCVKVLLQDPFGPYEHGPCVWNGRTWLYCGGPMMVVITRPVLGWREENESL